MSGALRVWRWRLSQFATSLTSATAVNPTRHAEELPKSGRSPRPSTPSVPLDQNSYGTILPEAKNAGRKTPRLIPSLIRWAPLATI